MNVRCVFNDETPDFTLNGVVTIHNAPDVTDAIELLITGDSFGALLPREHLSYITIVP